MALSTRVVSRLLVAQRPGWCGGRRRLAVWHRAFPPPVQLSHYQAQCSSSDTLLSKMEEHGVVPDVIGTVPKDVCQVSWDSAAKAELGNILTPTQVQRPPTVTYPAEPGAFYTVVMTDPDAPSRKDPKFREWHHWMVIDVPGCDVSKGTVNSEYVGSGPPPNTGLHRYVILVFKQPSGKMTKCSDAYRKKTGAGRGGWNTRKFAADNNLGEPVAGNLFQAEFDDYVPKLYEEMDRNK